MKNCLIFIFSILSTSIVFAQVGIGTTIPSSSSMLEVSSLSNGEGTYKGFMPPRVPNLAARDEINPSLEDAGLLVYVNSNGCLQVWSGHIWISVRCVEVQAEPVLLGRQYFEMNNSIPHLPYVTTGSGGFINNNMFVPRFPNTNMFVSSDTGYGVNNGSAQLIFGPVDASAYDRARLLLRLASFSTTNPGGADIDDIVVVAVSIDGGLTYSDELVVTGNIDSNWAFSSGIARLDYDGDDFPLTVTASSGLSAGVTKLRLTEIPATNDLMFKVTLTNDDPSEIWVIDDVEVYGY